MDNLHLKIVVVVEKAEAITNSLGCVFLGFGSEVDLVSVVEETEDPVEELEEFGARWVRWVVIGWYDWSSSNVSRLYLSLKGSSLSL